MNADEERLVVGCWLPNAQHQLFGLFNFHIKVLVGDAHPTDYCICSNHFQI